jgi:predicted phosphohydrolase
MKILITADLHYDIARSREPTEKLAREICRTPADALVLAGDTAGGNLAFHHEALALFDDFSGRKLLVPGNHCIWCAEDENSLDRYEQILPEVAAEHGFSVLDHQPAVLDGIALVGTIGWYDYTFADEHLAIPTAFYEAKVAPGAATYLGHDELIEAHREQLTERHLAMGVRWMDGVRVRLGMSDHAFCHRLADKLARQLNDVAREARQIIAILHHLPFPELVPRERPDRFAFAAAYLGASQLGDVLLGCEKLSHVYCGHSHWPMRVRVGNMEVVNIGSTYVEKRLEALELDASEEGGNR